jgi:DNA-binding Xre family transcriptional regulator
MNISYNKLWKLLIDRNMTKTDLRIKADINSATLAKMGKDLPVSMETIIKICKVLQCDVEDVLEIKENL